MPDRNGNKTYECVIVGNGSLESSELEVVKKAYGIQAMTKEDFEALNDESLLPIYIFKGETP